MPRQGIGWYQKGVQNNLKFLLSISLRFETVLSTLLNPLGPKVMANPPQLNHTSWCLAVSEHFLKLSLNFGNVKLPHTLKEVDEKHT